MTGLAERVLGYMDRPWRAVAIVVLLILFGLGFAAWEERVRLFGFLEVRHPAALKLGELQAAASNLLIVTTADVVTIWSVDIGANSQELLVAKQRNGRWDFGPTQLPVATETLSSSDIVKLFRGHPICDDPANRGSLLMKHLATIGMHRMCAAPAPPAPDLLLGVIYLAWRTPPDPPIEEAALHAELATASAIVSR
ncbi:MAG TPA: hypothetical protein VLN57_19535 [Xanthobacteraceae bacterium]|nr:hypothetical protein [Xanthobacteraceae bacterium]